MEAVHSNDKMWQCDMCPLAFKTKATLKQHQMRMHEKNEYFCDFVDPMTQLKCNAKFHARENWRVHKYKHKTAENYVQQDPAGKVEIRQIISTL